MTGVYGAEGHRRAATIPSMSAQSWVTPVTLSGTARPDGAAATSTTSRTSRRVAFDAAGLALDHRPADGRRRASRLARRGPRERGSRDRGAVRDRRPGDGPGDRQQPVHDHRPGAPAPRDRLDVGRHGVPAHRRQPGGQAAPADPRVRDARRASGSSSRPMPGTTRRGPRCSGSAPRSRASCATTRSCPTARTATPRSTAIIAPEWPAVRDRLRAKLAR